VNKAKYIRIDGTSWMQSSPFRHEL